jgi:hypothetical protein
MSFTPRDLDLSDFLEKALADELRSPDILVLATTLFSSSPNGQRAYLLAVPRVDEPVLVAASVWTGYENRPYFQVEELGPMSVMTRRRLPADLQRPLELDRESDASFADAAGGVHASNLWYHGLGSDAVCIVRSVSPDASDPVRIAFVAQWRADGRYESEVIGSASATELRELVEAEFSVVLAADAARGA